MFSIFQSALIRNSLRMKGKLKEGLYQKVKPIGILSFIVMNPVSCYWHWKNIYMLSGVSSVLITIDISILSGLEKIAIEAK